MGPRHCLLKRWVYVTTDATCASDIPMALHRFTPNANRFPGTKDSKDTGSVTSDTGLALHDSLSSLSPQVCALGLRIKHVAASLWPGSFEMTCVQHCMSDMRRPKKGVFEHSWSQLAYKNGSLEAEQLQTQRETVICMLHGLFACRRRSHLVEALSFLHPALQQGSVEVESTSSAPKPPDGLTQLRTASSPVPTAQATAANRPVRALHRLPLSCTCQVQLEIL